MLTISDSILKSANISDNELRQEIAIYLYSKNKLSIGKARKLAGLNIIQFQELLYNNNIPHNYGIKDLEEDFNTIKNYKK